MVLFFSPSAGDLRELPRVPLVGEGCCGVGGASRDSAGSGAPEEGLTSRGGTLVVQWLRIHLPMQGTQVQSLIQEDLTCFRATKPMCHNY